MFVNFPISILTDSDIQVRQFTPPSTKLVCYVQIFFSHFIRIEEKGFLCFCMHFIYKLEAMSKPFLSMIAALVVSRYCYASKHSINGCKVDDGYPMVTL